MRALVVSNMYPPHHLGGYELTCRDTVQRFQQRGHEVVVLTSTMRRPEVDDPSADEADVRRRLTLYWRDHEIVRPSAAACLRIERGNHEVLDGALDELRPDVVSFWNMGALSVGLVTAVAERGIPCVLVVCDDWLVYAPLVDGWARRFHRHRHLGAVARRLSGLPTGLPDVDALEGVCFVSESVRRTARDNTPWRFAGSTVTLSGYDRGDFPPPGPGEEAGPWRGRLLYVGRIEPRKGVETVVRALALLPGHTLEVVGPPDPVHLVRVRAVAEELGVSDRVCFDDVARKQLRARYLTADAVVFPSEWAEPFGLIPLEAMACGRPVLATGTGGSGEFLVDEGNCLLFPPRGAPGLAAAVRRLAGDERLRRELVARGHETADRLDTDRLADVLEAEHERARARRRGQTSRRRSGPGRLVA